MSCSPPSIYSLETSAFFVMKLAAQHRPAGVHAPRSCVRRAPATLHLALGHGEDSRNSQVAAELMQVLWDLDIYRTWNYAPYP